MYIERNGGEFMPRKRSLHPRNKHVGTMVTEPELERLQEISENYGYTISYLVRLGVQRVLEDTENTLVKGLNV